MHRIISLEILLLVIALVFSGCYDAREINDVAYVLLVGVDMGVSDRFRVTFKFPSLKSGGGQDDSSGQAGDGLTYDTLTIDTPSFFAASELANINLARSINFMHTQFIVISEDIARNGLIGEFLAQIVRNSSIRYSTRLLISKGSAAELVEMLEPIEGSDLTKTCENLARQSEETGMFVDLALYDLHDCMKSTYHQPIAVLAAVNRGENFVEEGSVWGNKYQIPGDYYAGDQPRKGGGKVELMGLAIFNGTRMVGKLTGHESRILAMVKGNFRKGTLVIPDPKQPGDIIAFEVRPARKPQVKIWFDGDKPFIDLKLHLEGDILGIQSGIHYEDLDAACIGKCIELFIKTELNKILRRPRNLTVIYSILDILCKAFCHYSGMEAMTGTVITRMRNKTEVRFYIRRTGTRIHTSKQSFPRRNNEILNHSSYIYLLRHSLSYAKYSWRNNRRAAMV